MQRKHLFTLIAAAVSIMAFVGCGKSSRPSEAASHVYMAQLQAVNDPSALIGTAEVAATANQIDVTIQGDRAFTSTVHSARIAEGTCEQAAGSGQPVGLEASNEQSGVVVGLSAEENRAHGASAVAKTDLNQKVIIVNKAAGNVIAPVACGALMEQSGSSQSSGQSAGQSKSTSQSTGQSKSPAQQTQPSPTAAPSATPVPTPMPSPSPSATPK